MSSFDKKLNNNNGILVAQPKLIAHKQPQGPSDSLMPEFDAFNNTSHLEYIKTYNDKVINTIAAFLNSDGGEIRFDVTKDSTKRVIKNNIKNNLVKFLYPEGLFSKLINYSEDAITIEKSPIPFFIKSDDINNKRVKRYTLYSRVNSKNTASVYKKKEADSLLKIFCGIKTITSASIKKNYEYEQIGQFSWPKKLYKYMSLETALLCVRGSSLRFSEPSSWLDKREQIFYTLPYFDNNQTKDNPPLVACCLTHKEYNEAAWKIYSYEKKGLDSRCVEFTINTNEFFKQIIGSINNGRTSTDGVDLNHYKLYVGLITYKNDQFYELLQPANTYLYDEFFKQFSFDKYLSLLLLKHIAFEHEQEIRFFLIPDENEIKSIEKGKVKSIDIIIDWAEVIEGVKIDDNCSKFEKELLKDELKKKGHLGHPVDGDKEPFLTPTPYNVYDQSIPLPESFNIKK